MHIGVVNVLTNFIIEGWAVEPDQTTPATVDIFADDELIAVVKPSVFRQDLVNAGIGDGNAGFRFYFPDIASHTKNINVVVKRSSTGDQLSGPTLVERLAILYAAPIPRNPAQTYSASTIVATSPEPGILEVTAAIVTPPNSETGVLPLSKSVNRISDISIGGNQLTAAFNKAGLDASISIPRGIRFVAHFDPQTAESFLQFKLVERNPDLAAAADHRYSPSACFAATHDLSWMTFAKEENSSRTCGAGSTSSDLANTGLSTAYQLYSIYKAHRKDPLETVLDWGVGYGRVAIPFKRVVAPDARIIGIDVDNFNVDWCRENVKDVDVSLCDFVPPTKIDSDSVDLVYAISVMNHLTEINQIRWLLELRRILKPGGIAILTAVTQHGLVTYQHLDPITLRDVYTRGIADAILDYNLGPHLAIKDYYRMTYQLTDHIKSLWGQFFEIVDIYPGAVNGMQDAVVMRRR